MRYYDNYKKIWSKYLRSAKTVGLGFYWNLRLRLIQALIPVKPAATSFTLHRKLLFHPTTEFQVGT
jgi:hypothetical protein